MFKKIDVLLAVIFLVTSFVSVGEVISINYETLPDNDLDIDFFYLNLECGSLQDDCSIVDRDYETFNVVGCLGNVNVNSCKSANGNRFLYSKLNNYNFTNDDNWNFLVYYVSEVNFNNKNVKFLFNEESYLGNILNYNLDFDYIFSLNRVCHVSDLVVYKFINNSICNFCNLSIKKFYIVLNSILTFNFSLIISYSFLLFQNFYLSIFSKIFTYSFIYFTVFSYLNNKDAFKSPNLRVVELVFPPINLYLDIK